MFHKLQEHPTCSLYSFDSFYWWVNNTILRNVVENVSRKKSTLSKKILKLQSTIFALKSLCQTIDNIHVFCHVDNGSAIT